MQIIMNSNHQITNVSNDATSQDSGHVFSSMDMSTEDLNQKMCSSDTVNTVSPTSLVCSHCPSSLSMDMDDEPLNQNKNLRENLKRDQLRLLEIRHAVKCTRIIGKCRIISQCEKVKILYRHALHCRVRNCRVPHCLSTRSVLNHHAQCANEHCRTCAPVRAAMNIDRSFQSEQVPGAHTI
jgi:hypothetical protein